MATGRYTIKLDIVAVEACINSESVLEGNGIAFFSFACAIYALIFFYKNPIILSK